MRSVRIWLVAHAVAVAVAIASIASAQDGRTCDAKPAPAAGPIALVILANPEKVAALAASLPPHPISRRDETTVVYADGRVLTADVGRASAFLNELGWGHRRIEVVASAPRPRARARAVG